MDLLLEARITIDGDAQPDVLTLRGYPARIGRDEGCSICLPYPFVSRQHARIERQEGGLVLIDEGSRNGVTLNGSRVPPGVPVPLPIESEIVIQRVVVTLRIRELTQLLGAATGAADPTTTLYSAQLLGPEVLTRVGAALAQYRAARAAAHTAVVEAMSPLVEGHRPAMAERLAAEYPELRDDPTIQQALAARGIDLRPAPRIPEEAAQALEGLQRLASTYVPDRPPPRTAPEVTALFERIGLAFKTLVEFVGGVGPDDHDAMDPGRAAASLARDLLDWKSGPRDVFLRVQHKKRVVEARTAALASDVEAAIELLVGELSPAAIEWHVGGSRWLGPFRFLRLWREFRRRHLQLTSGLSGDEHRRLSAGFIPDETTVPSRCAVGAVPDARAGAPLGSSST